jgi:hypothetical protein
MPSSVTSIHHLSLQGGFSVSSRGRRVAMRGGRHAAATAVTVLLCMCELHSSHAFGTISPARSTGLWPQHASTRACFDCSLKAYGRASRFPALPRLGLRRPVARVAAINSPHSGPPSSCSVPAVSPPAPRARTFCEPLVRVTAKVGAPLRSAEFCLELTAVENNCAPLHTCVLICMSTRTHATGHIEPCVRTHSQQGSMA